VSQIGRRIRAAVNPVSTAATGWWCHSAMRHTLTGYGPTARQRRLIRRGKMRDAGPRPPASRMAGQMKARAAAIDQLLARDDQET
jgi:hypothetical protein